MAEPGATARNVPQHAFYCRTREVRCRTNLPQITPEASGGGMARTIPGGREQPRAFLFHVDDARLMEATGEASSRGTGFPDGGAGPLE